MKALNRQEIICRRNSQTEEALIGYLAGTLATPFDLRPSPPL
ncbi:MAG: hypothetical protein ACRCTY_05605 [Candidatus Adiutrix sp.]